MNAETFIKLKEIYDEHCLGDLTIKDIEELEINNKLLSKYINSYRLALVVQKVSDEGNDIRLNSQINLCSMFINELMGWLGNKRKDYYKKKKEKEKEKEEE